MSVPKPPNHGVALLRTLKPLRLFLQPSRNLHRLTPSRKIQLQIHSYSSPHNIDDTTKLIIAQVGAQAASSREQQKNGRTDPFEYEHEQERPRASPCHPPPRATTSSPPQPPAVSSSPPSSASATVGAGAAAAAAAAVATTTPVGGSMVPMMLVAAASILIPLSLCVVPSLARFTVFPLLSSLITRFGGAYLLPCLSVEYTYGSFDLLGRARHVKETLRAFTISLLQIQLQPEFLKTLAFEHKGLAPVVLGGVSIKRVALRLASTWRVVLEIDGIDVEANLMDVNAPGVEVADLKDAVAMKLGDVAGWMVRFTTQKAKDEQEAETQKLAESARKFSFKDRVMQLVMAQVEVQVRDVCVNVNAPPSVVASAKNTRVCVVLKEILLSSKIAHDDAVEALELVQTSTDIRVTHKISIDGTSISAGKVVVTTAVTSSASSSSDAQAKAAEAEAANAALVPLFELPELELTLDAPPMARVLGLVPSFAPIPLEKRTCRVKLVMPANNRITLDKETLILTLRDAVVPFADYQVVIKTLRMLELEESEKNAASTEEVAEYVELFRRVETEPKLSATVKKEALEKMATLEPRMTLDTILKARTHALGLDKYFMDRDATDGNSKELIDDGFDLEACGFLAEKLAKQPANVMFSGMQIALSVNSFAVAFKEGKKRSIAELGLHEFGVNMKLFPLGESQRQGSGDEKLLQDIEVTLVQVVVAVSSRVSTVGPAESPESKIVYADFSQLPSTEDEEGAAVVARPVQIAAMVRQYDSGRQAVEAALRGLQIVAAANELEFFLMFVDRLNTDVAQVMSSARPQPSQRSLRSAAATPDELEEEGGDPAAGQETAVASTVAGSAEALPNASPMDVNMAPFSLLGGMQMQLDVVVEGCRVALLPTNDFSGSTEDNDGYDAYDVGTQLPPSKRVPTSRILLPFDLHLHLSSSPSKEQVQLDVHQIGVIAEYHALATVSSAKLADGEDVEALLAPAAFTVCFALRVDEKDPLLCHQSVTAKMPDFVFAFSELSLALMSSCLKSLSGIKTTTPELAQRRMESKSRQEELRKQAEVEAILDRIHRMFDEIDVDKNGHIELGELLALLRRAGVGDTLLEREVERFVRILFAEIDRDGNGSIEFEELRAYLKDDLLSGDGTAMTETAGSGELEGSLNLRGGEYHSVVELEKLSDSKPTTREQLEVCVAMPAFQARFWDLYTSETHATQTSLKGQRPIEVQKQLVRLLKHYEAAELCWMKLISPALVGKEGKDWVLQPGSHCGGVSEFQSAAKVIARQKKDSIFAVALRDAESKRLLAHSAGTKPVKKQLRFSTDLRLGNLQFILMDPVIPVRFSRGDLAIKNLKLSLMMNSKEIDAHMPVDWVGMTTSGNAEWTVLFGVQLAAATYSEVANDMENVIEPWGLAMAISSAEQETGFSALVEAEKRMQINVTPAFLSMYRALNEVTAGGDAGSLAWKKHRDAVRSGLIAQSQPSEQCFIQNMTGCTVFVTMSGSEERLEIASDERVYTTLPKVDGVADTQQIATLEKLELDTWGQTSGPIILPSFGSTNVRVSSHAANNTAVSQAAAETLFVTAYSRLDDPLRQRIVLKSNMFVHNHSTHDYDLKYLTIGSEERAAVASAVMTVPSGGRTALPLPVLMGITEIYARPSAYSDWTVKAKLNGDLITSAEAIAAFDAQELDMKAKQLKRRGGALVYGDTQDTCSTIVKQLAPSIVVRRWHLRSHVEWEMSLLPPFVVRNSLPYVVEYRFAEYKVKAGKHVASDFKSIETALCAENAQQQAEAADVTGTKVISGHVPSGQDAEISGISGFSPGYLAMRLVGKSNGSAQRIVTPWSKPYLMAIHSTVDHFTTAREFVEPIAGVRFSLDRATQPNLPRMVRLSAPYWVVNNSSIDLEVASAAPGAKVSNGFTGLPATAGFTSPQMVYLEHDRLTIKPTKMCGMRPRAWNSLGKVAPSAFTSNLVSDTALKSATWSEPMNSTTVNTVGELACGSNVMGVKIAGLYGAFEQSIALTVSPRFYVQNRLREKMYFRSFGSSDSPESADEQFQKKLSDASLKELQLPLESGQTTPVYHVGKLKNGEPLNVCPKYMSISFDEDGDSKSWSHVIPISTAGDLYLQLYSPLRKKYIICQASVQVIDMYVYVVLSDSSGSPPYRIENYTPFKVTCSQVVEASSLFRSAEKDSEHVVKTGEWYAFAWQNSLAKEHAMEIVVEHNDGRKDKQTYDVDGVGYHQPIVLEKSTDRDGNTRERVEIVVQTVVDEGTRVLKFVEKELELSRFENQDPQEDAEFEQRKMLYASSFDVRFAGFGLSLFDALPQEVLFVSVDVLQMQKPPSSLSWAFSLLHSQVDNMLPSAKFPVIVNPMNSGYSDKTVGQPPKPLVNLQLESDLFAKSGIFKQMEFQLSSLALKVDLDFIVNLVKLVEPFLASETALQLATIQTLNIVLKSEVPPVPAVQVTSDGKLQRDMVYFDVLRIASITVDLEYSITRRDIVSSAGGAGGNSIVFGLLTQVVGLIGSNMSGSPTLSFSEIVIVRCFSTKERLQSQLIQNFVRQAVMQAYRLVGSADIIGNPIGLVEDLGSGVVEFLKITKGEVMGDSQTRGEGVKVLGKTIAQSGASSVAKITGSLDKFVGDFAEEEEVTRHGADGDSGADSTTGVAAVDGGLKFVKNFGKGLTGIITKPVEGAMKGGVTGLLQGTVQGIAGPGVVILKQITSTSHTLALGVQSTVVDRSVFGGRRRQPKKVDDSKVIADFDAEHYRATRMYMQVISAQGLLSDKSCDPLCVVRVDGTEVLRTNVLYNTLNPHWQEKAQLELTGAEDEVQLVVKDSYGGAIEKTIGKCIVSMARLQEDFRPPEFASNLARWVQTGERPEETKKNISNQVKEKEYILTMPTQGGSSSHGLMNDGFQVLVTVLSLRDLRVTSSSGGGMLGLGNLVSSTPNIDPYVSIHVAKGKTHTHTSEMKFVGSGKKDNPMRGSADWNESYAFPLARRAFTDGAGGPEIMLSLKDKGMLHDETLGYSGRTLSMDEESMPAVVEELTLYEDRARKGEVIGVLTVKIEMTSATVAPSTNDTPKPALHEGESAMPMGSPDGSELPTPSAPGALRAGKIRVSCEFV